MRRLSGRGTTLSAGRRRTGKKWHPLLLRTLPTEGSLEFNDVKSSTDGVSDKVLSGSLDDLGESGLVVRDVVEDKPVRVHCSLTPASRDLDPALRGYRSGTTSISARVADRSDGSP
ncbi:transcriptional regulator [Halobacteriales archaeon QH_8_67_36]|nr:MAG: transcriptional regulator [Halobacteriales archaeon QH_8_67_36]